MSGTFSAYSLSPNRVFARVHWVVVTTLLDAQEFRAEEIGELYRRRWQAELNLRAVKVTMGLDVLRAKTPEMVRKELWTGLLAYNLIRRTMLQAAHAAELLPNQLSFTAALQTIAASWLTTLFLDDKVKAALFRATHLGSHPTASETVRIALNLAPLSVDPNRTTC